MNTLYIYRFWALISMHRVSVIKFHTPALNYRQPSLYLSATSTPKPRFLRRVLNYVKQEPLSFAGHLLFTLVCTLVFWCGAQWMHYKCSALKMFFCLSDWGRDSSLALLKCDSSLCRSLCVGGTTDKDFPFLTLCFNCLSAQGTQLPFTKVLLLCRLHLLLCGRSS